MIGIQGASGETGVPVKVIYGVTPFATQEGICFGADLEDVGYPGVTSATLAHWPNLWQHPEATLMLQVISTLIEGVGRSPFTKPALLESIYPLMADGEFSARDRFERLNKVWQRETVFLSHSAEMAAHPAYQSIIGMGPFALPFIFAKLRGEPDHWFHALRAITGDDPVPDEDRGQIDKMRDHWLNWGVEHGYVG